MSLGAAYAAGLAVGFWPDIDALRDELAQGRRVAAGDGRPGAREGLPQVAQGGTERTLDWVDDDDDDVTS